MASNSIVSKIVVSPNPFNPSTTIVVEATSDKRKVTGETITAQVYNLNGTLVQTLVANNSSKVNGRLSPVAFTWNASSNPSGIYIVRASFNGKKLSKRILLAK